MVTLNATFIIQILHFLFVWWFLDKFVFKLFIRDIQTEQAKVSKLSGQVMHERSLVQEEYGRKAHQWEKFRKGFAQNIPIVEPPVHTSFTAILCPVDLKIEDDRKNKIIEDTKNILLKEVLKNV
jgi:hypothetical protein